MNDRLQAATSGRSGPPLEGFAAWIGGRARRGEYWAWMVPLIILELVISGFGVAAMIIVGIGRLLIWIRRLHDLGWTGWMAPVFNVALSVTNVILLTTLGAKTAVLVTSGLVLAAVIALGCVPSEARDNEFGPGPKGRTDLKETFS